MSDERKPVAERILRLAKMLRYFLERDEVYTTNMAADFSTTTRTIQRDLLALRKAGFPIHEKRMGCHCLDKSIISNLRNYEESELALIVAVRDMVRQLGKPFGDNADTIFNRLSDYTDCRPVFVKLDEPIRFPRKTVDKIVEGINEKKFLQFEYKGNMKEAHPVTVEPYRTAYFDGFWYLIARDSSDDRIKKYALDKISGITALKNKRFKKIPDDIDDILKSSVNVWFTTNRNIRVTIEVDSLWADYFKRRGNILPLQETAEERPDGSLIINFMACNTEEISMCVKPWLPHVRIIKPESVKISLLNEFSDWIKWQKKT